MSIKLAPILVILSVFFSHLSSASVIINGTRVVYPENEKEVTIKLTNTGKVPVLVQSWIDNGNADEKPETIQVPFVLIPAINRIDAGKSQTLRLSYTSIPTLPNDKESVFWLNVLEIPPSQGDSMPNRLQIAFRSRIKLFYRPAKIEQGMKAEDAAEKISWSVVDGKLRAFNSSPYYVSLASVNVNQQGKKDSIDGEMIAPGTAHDFSAKNLTALSPDTSITYEYINDWGAVKSVKVAH